MVEGKSCLRIRRKPALLTMSLNLVLLLTIVRLVWTRFIAKMTGGSPKIRKAPPTEKDAIAPAEYPTVVATVAVAAASTVTVVTAAVPLVAAKIPPVVAAVAVILAVATVAVVAAVILAVATVAVVAAAVVPPLANAGGALLSLAFTTTRT